MNLNVGVAVIDVTPPLGTQLAGMIGMPRPVEEIDDPLLGRILIAESGGVTVCFVSLEVLALADDQVALIRDRIQAEHGLPPESVLLHAVQNHAAPMIGARVDPDDCDWLPENGGWLVNDALEYAALAADRIVEGVGQALADREPVTVRAARGVNTSVAFCRRFIMRDGTSTTHVRREQFPNVLRHETPIDPEVGVVVFETADRAKAILLHHTCHPVHGVSGRVVSAGWPGVWCRQVEAANEGAVAMLVNGCCGNVHHANHLDPSHDDSKARIGASLSATVTEAMTRLDTLPGVPVAYESTRVQIAYRTVDAATLSDCRAFLAQYPEPKWLDEAHTRVDWEWCYATSVLDVHRIAQREAEYGYEVQVLRIGDLALVGLTGEPFVQAQFEIKLESPLPYTFPAHMSNGYVGYLPTRDAFSRGSYETRTALWSRLDPGALEAVTAESIASLRRV